MYVKCIKEWHSEIFPEKDYGILGTEYLVLNQTPLLTDKPIYLSLAGIDPLPGGGYGWVNAERFEKV